MNLSAVYHISTDNYCYPLNENELVIKIQTGYDVDRVQLMYGDPFKSGIFGGNDVWSGTLIDMQDVKFLEHHKVWQAIVKPEFKRCRYYFILHSGDEVIYMIEDSFRTPEEFKRYKGRRQDFFYPWINSADVVKPAEWVNQTVWYQIFPDRFCNSGAEREHKFKKWSKPNQKVRNDEFYGGDIKGAESRLDYLKSLGINGIYFTPLNKSSSVHKYNTSDYAKIDEDFGTENDLKEFVQQAHKRGIRVMLDGVFNHSGSDFAPWKDVLKNGENSAYYDWFMINAPVDSFSKLSSNSRKGKYYTFAFVDGMPKLNTNNQAVVDYIINVCTDWVKKYDIDAIRLDVANETSHFFNRQLRKAMFSRKKDFYICGEIWHSSMAWLRGDEFDSVMNYSLQESVDSFWNNTEMTALEFEYQINRCYNMYPVQSANVMFNLLDSHDTMRLITRSSNNADVFIQKLCTLFTMNGTTCIYYGTEIMLEGGYDPDCRRCMPWNEIDNGLYDDKIAIVKSIISMRNNYTQLRNGSIRFVRNENNRVIEYEKYDNNTTLRIILNCSNENIKVDTTDTKIIFSNKFKENVIAPDGTLILVI